MDLLPLAIQTYRKYEGGDDQDGIEIVKILLDAGADINAKRGKPEASSEQTNLSLAIACNHPAVELLVERGATF